MIYLQYKFRRAELNQPRRILLLSELGETDTRDVMEELAYLAPESILDSEPDSGVDYDLAVLGYHRPDGMRDILRTYWRLKRIHTQKIMLYERKARKALIFDKEKLLRRTVSSLAEILLVNLLKSLTRRIVLIP